MASQVYTEEQLNYFRICYIATDILPRGLQAIFKQEWDNRHKATLGEWQDTPKNGMDFINGESSANQRRNGQLLATMINGNRSEWDCTMLFYAILHSDSIDGLDLVIRSNVDDLRAFRNEWFAHTPQGQLSNERFGVAVHRVEIAFQLLGLSTAQIRSLGQQNSFPTDELQRSEVQRQGAEEQRQTLERQLQHEVEPFCVLPPKPPHQIAGRDREVAKIENELDNLRKANPNSLSYCYISGNPGSGKSQLAGLVAKQFYDKTIKGTSSVPFVMTLNAEKVETLLESYVSLARKMSCPEYAVTNTHNSKGMEIVEKITSLNDLIETKISLFSSWLLVVDNVTSVSRTNGLLPEPGREQWGKGQLLITTQDSFCIPPDSSFISHISTSKGMDPSDAACLLSVVSGIKDQEMEDKVAKALDHQPLALGSAAMYVTQVRKLSPSFGWKDYLEKLEQGKRALTENILAKTNTSYPSSMTAATRLAVEREMNSNEVMKHAFTFLALCSPQLLKLDFLTNYILIVDKDQDKEEIGIQIQGSSLFLIEKQQDGVYIRQHQVVHDIVKLVVQECMDTDGHARAVDAAVKSFNQFIHETMPNSWDELDSVPESRHFVPHLKTLIVEIEDIFPTQQQCQIFVSSTVNVSLSSFNFRRLGRICQCHGEFFSAKEYYGTAVKLIEVSEACDGDDEELARGCIGLGRVNSSLGYHREGKECLERALTICEKRMGPEHVDVARCYAYLGTVHRRLGYLQQAKEHYQRSLSILLSLKLESDNDDVAYTQRNLGSVQRDLGDNQQAKEHLERALFIYLNRRGRAHVDVGRTFHNLGILHYTMGNLEQAKKDHESALSILLKKLGPEHVEVARAYQCLGVVHCDLGDHQQAKENYERALSIFLKKLGPDHDDSVRTNRNLRLCGNAQ